ALKVSLWNSREPPRWGKSTRRAGHRRGPHRELCRGRSVSARPSSTSACGLRSLFRRLTDTSCHGLPTLVPMTIRHGPPAWGALAVPIYVGHGIRAVAVAHQRLFTVAALTDCYAAVITSHRRSQQACERCPRRKPGSLS